MADRRRRPQLRGPGVREGVSMHGPDYAEMRGADTSDAYRRDVERVSDELARVTRERDLAYQDVREELAAREKLSAAVQEADRLNIEAAATNRLLREQLK